MNYKEAKAAIEFHNGTSLEKSLETMHRSIVANGFIEAIDKMKPLVDALEYLDIHNGGHTPTIGNTGHATCNQCIIEKALADYKREVLGEAKARDGEKIL